MPKKLNPELESLVQLVGNSFNGLSIEEIIDVMGNSVPRRTVQYRLLSLVKSGFLRREGRARSVRYYGIHEKRSLRLKESR